jgi:hypothetical protein
MSITPLFDERAPLDREKLAAALGRLAAERIRVGTSSWSNPNSGDGACAGGSTNCNSSGLTA